MLLGNDPVRLDDLATSMDRMSRFVRESGNELSRLASGARWVGPDRERFLRGHDALAADAGRAADSLTEAARILRREAADQRRTSDAGTPSPPAVPETVPVTAPETVLEDDPRGDGRRVVAVGRVPDATDVVIVVPGMGTTADTFDSLLRDARRLHEAASGLDETRRVAVVAWLGYDAPAGLSEPWEWNEVLTPTRAHAGARELRTFLRRLDLAPGADVTLVGHSYGSLVAAEAADDPLVDRLVVLGSPGLGVDRVADLGLAPGTEVYAAAFDNDLVARSGWFGTPPTDPGFGAHVLDADPGHGEGGPPITAAHSSYFDRGSRFLETLGGVVIGRADVPLRGRR